MQNDSDLLDLVEDQCLDLRCRDVAGGEYYYRVSACTARNADDPECICWHPEGQGPFPNRREGDDAGTPLEWRRTYSTEATGPGATTLQSATVEPHTAPDTTAEHLRDALAECARLREQNERMWKALERVRGILSREPQYPTTAADLIWFARTIVRRALAEIDANA